MSIAEEVEFIAHPRSKHMVTASLRNLIIFSEYSIVSVQQ